MHRSLAADSGEEGSRFTGLEVAGQLVAERGAGGAGEAAFRRGTGVCVTRQR
jgi:hypothetical protein